jgi:hypothetical protein
VCRLRGRERGPYRREESPAQRRSRRRTDDGIVVGAPGEHKAAGFGVAFGGDGPEVKVGVHGLTPR